MATDPRVDRTLVNCISSSRARFIALRRYWLSGGQTSALPYWLEAAGLCVSFNRRIDLIPLVVFAIISTLTGCAQVDVVAERATDEIREGGAEYADIDCDQRGPRIRTGDNSLGADDCDTAGPLRAFRHALCVCSDYTAGARLTIDAFDSSQGDSEPLSDGGSVGINGEIQNNGFVFNIDGSLRVAGGRGISLSGNAEIQVGQELEVQSAILGEQASVTVGGDARIGGDIRLGAFRVDGTLRMPGDAELMVSETSQINTVRKEPIQVEPPCGCAEEDIVDIPALVAKANEDNDNALLDFEINELENFAGPITRRFPCGRFYLRRLNGTGALVLSITGRVALYVAEHVDFQDRVTVELEPEAEFELYLADSMVASSDLTFGSADSPARARLFVGGSGTLEIRGENRFSGQIYAPRSELVVTDASEIFGSVFVRRAALSAPLTIHYDRNPIETGRVCSD